MLEGQKCGHNHNQKTQNRRRGAAENRGGYGDRPEEEKRERVFQAAGEIQQHGQLHDVKDQITGSFQFPDPAL